MTSPLTKMITAPIDTAIANGFLNSAEVDAICENIGDITDSATLKDVYAAVRGAVSANSVDHTNRKKLLNALFTKQSDLHGGMIMPAIITMAVGEDQFGIDNNPFGRDLVLKTAADGVVSTSEAKALAALYGKCGSEWDVAALHEATSTLVNNNTISSQDRSKLVHAYIDAAKNNGGGPIRMTRMVGEDVFGQDRAVLGNTKLAVRLETAGRNKCLSAAEVSVLRKEIKTLRTPEAVEAAFHAVRETIGELATTSADRSKLISAFYAAAQKTGAKLPMMVTRMAGEDAFGTQFMNEIKIKQGLAKAGTDEALNNKEVSNLKTVIKAAGSMEELREIRDELSAFVHANSCSREDRGALAKAVTARAAELKTAFNLSKSVGEDIFGQA